MTTTKRLYYTCPIKALYMMKEFEVKIEQLVNYSELPRKFIDVSIKEMIDDILPYFNPKYEMQNRLYTKKESEHIFEPKHLDYRMSQFDSGGYKSVSMYLMQNGNHQLYKTEIILRNGKQFFSPEVENENN